jgi:hypothetical protein
MMIPLVNNDCSLLFGCNILTRLLVCASFIASIAAGSVNAQQPPTAALGITLTLQQKVQVPGTSYEFVLGSFELSPDGSASTEALLTALVTWLSANFDLPATYDHSRIVPMSSVAMTNLLYRIFLGDQPREGSVPENQGQSDQRRQVISLYNIPTKTIYLLPEWTGRTPAELSMFVHEMVHHLQNVAHTAYACPQEREALAYEAQEKWLSLFGRDLLGDFKIDPFTLLMNTKCLS